MQICILLQLQDVIWRTFQISTKSCQYVKVKSGYFAFAVVIELCALQMTYLTDTIFADILVFYDTFKVNINRHNVKPLLYLEL